MDKKLFEKIKHYSDEACKILPVEKIILYGSYARGEERPESDIDIAVVVNKLSESFIKTSAMLFKISRSIDSLIEPKLIRAQSKSGFLESIEKYGIIVYEKKE